MSVDLMVKLRVPMDRERLLLDCSQVFSCLLNISSQFEFAFFDNHSLGPRLLGQNVYLDEYEQEACPPWMSEDKVGTYATVNTGGNVAVRYVVAASVIIALAHQSGGFITNDDARWIKPQDQQMLDKGYDVDRFFQALRNPQAFEVVEEAAAVFYERLPVHLKGETEAELSSA